MENLQQYVETELNILLEDERKKRLNTPIEELEQEVEMLGGRTSQEAINDAIRKVTEPAYDMPDLSEASLDYVYRAAYLLINRINISPLTLTDDEFELVQLQDKKVYQNKRNPRVYKSNEGNIYHLDGEEALAVVCGKFNTRDKSEESKYEQLQLDLDC